MNKHEYWKLTNKQSTSEYRHIHKLLEQWRLTNNITESCIVHHKDDTEECRKYNEEHYELWGCNLDGTFEYGKYVVFMTRAEHTRYHSLNRSEETLKKIIQSCIGNKRGLGYKHTDIERKKISDAQIGKHRSVETREKMSIAQKGKKFSNETKEKLSAVHKGKNHSDETKAKMRATNKAISTLWNAYKINNGILSYNEFKRALKNGEITFEMQTISVFINGGK